MLQELQGVSVQVSSGEFQQALIVLTRVLPELEQSLGREDARAVQLLGNGYYLLGVCHLELESYEEAIDALETFLQLLPTSPNVFKARLMMGEAFFYQQEWEEVPKAVAPLLSSRMVPAGELEMAHQLAGQSFQELENWERALPSWQWLFQRGSRREVRTTAAGSIAICLIRLGRFADLYRFVPALLPTNANTSIQLNLQLVFEGDRLLQDGVPDQALLLYRLVMPTQSLIQDLNRREEDATREIDQLKRMNVLTEPLRQRGRQLEQALLAIEASREELEAFPEYDEELRLRLADCYQQLARYEEAIQLYLALRDQAPDSEIAQQALYSAYMVAFTAEDPDRALEIARLYMEDYPGGEYWEDVTLHAASLLLQLERWSEAEALVAQALKVTPDHVTLDHMLYIQGYAQFMQNDIRSAIRSMNRLLAVRSNSTFSSNARYWIALGQLFLENYEEARDGFRDLSRGEAIPDIRMDAAFRQGVAEYGLGDFPVSTETFRTFLETYPASPLAAEALAMIGDMQAAEGLLDEAIGSYEDAMEQAVNQVQGDYVAFQMARTYELENRWQEILDLFDRYLEQFGEEANVTQAAYWKGNALTQLGNPDEARRLFLETVVQHGHDPAADGIDFILRDLIEDMHTRLQGQPEADEIRTLVENAKEEADLRGDRALELRLIGFQIETAPNEDLVELLTASLLQEKNLEEASPGVLALMGRLAEDSSTPELGLRAYEVFLERYPESDLILEALKGLAEARVDAGDLNGAIQLFEEVTERFPLLPHGADARLRLGDLYRQQGEPDKAIEAYTLILSVKEWRGELWPTALLRLGDTEMERERFLEASGYYQRVYVMYTGFPALAAEAYYKGAQALQNLGESDKMREVLEEMLDQPEFANQPVAREARILLMSQP
jgi:TolA-binding protein